MALINCPECGTQVSNKADKCPKCAYPLKGEATVKTEGCFLQTMNLGCTIIFAIIMIIIVIIILGVLFGS